jgi:UDP-GlcNAc3NAcA epimerase
MCSQLARFAEYSPIPFCLVMQQRNTEMKILTIIGARPQFIKAVSVSRALRAIPQLTEVLVHTGQHYDDNMSAVFFQEMELPQPQYHLGIGSGNHGAQTGRMLERVEEVILTEKPDRVLVYGDTNSTLAGALAAVKLNVPVAHVEAGLRSFNRRMPEEINRVLTDHVADLLFAPTEAAVANLRREGMSERMIYLVGDVMYDASLYYMAKAEQESRILPQLGLTPGEYILATIHRAENTDNSERLRTIIAGLNHISHEIPVVLPLHPRTRAAIVREDLPNHLLAELMIIEPVGYQDMLMLEKNARLVATDSGGVQKEAFFFRVPCVTLREETEWVELVELGWNKVVPPLSIQAISEAALSSFQGEEEDPYGGGKASDRIIKILLEN